MKSYSSRELKKLVEEHGWCCVRVNGDDHIFRHDKSSKVMSFAHPKKTVSRGTTSKILRILKEVAG